jgi:hypothetical protein
MVTGPWPCGESEWIRRNCSAYRTCG